MKFIDWFAGIGGFRRGMELAGHECVGFCEFDKYAVMSYTAMHLCTQEQLDYLATLPLKQRQKEILKDEYKNGEWYANDVRRVDARDIPEADCWCFGFPCQDISVAGKQAGFNGTRSSLFFEVMRLLDERKENGLSCPGYLFIENVKNLLSINRGIDFAKVLFALDERGYDAEWTLLNSKNFGVPQNRERVFVIGHLRSGCTAEVFPVEGADGANCVCGIGHRNGYRRNTQIFDRGGITEALDTAQGGGRGHHTIEVIGKAYDRDNYGDNRNRVLGEGGVLSEPDGNAVQGTLQNRVIAVGNTNPSGKGMSGTCYSPGGSNPLTICNESRIKTVGPNTTGKNGGDITQTSLALTARSYKGLSKSFQKMTVAMMCFAIDKGVKSCERQIANCITAREDRGLSRHEQEGTLICHRIWNQ